MIASWQAFLEEAGARFESGRVNRFGNPQEEARAAAEGNVVADLSHFGLVRVAGEDAPVFLQGQFSNDVRRVTDDAAQLSSYCSPKGRMLAIFRLFRHDGAYYLRMPAELVESFAKRLRMFVLMSKVTVEDASADLVRIGVSGERATERLRNHLGALPESVDSVVHALGLTVVRIPGSSAPRFEIYGEEAAVRGVWEALSESATPVGADAWALLDIRAGVPTLYPDTVEAFVPQMANMQLVDGVSFRKGCYPGQEIVARMQYLGQLKRRMYLAHVDTDVRPAPGTALFAPGTESGQGTGKVVDARPAPEGGYDLLAVIVIDQADQGEVSLGENDGGPKLSIRALPYSFEKPVDAPASEQ